MFLLLLTMFLFAHGTASSDVPFTRWHPTPTFRGTWDLIVSCVLTLTVGALHLNVPNEGSTRRERTARHLRWILLGLFVPELVVSTAFAQYLTASWLFREIRKDVKYRETTKDIDPNCSEETQLQKWSMTQCYFTVMGGLKIETDKQCIAGAPRLCLTAEGVRLMSFLGRLPDVPEEEIRRQNKADGVAKLLVILQAGWFILQTLARVQQKLPVTLLEIYSIGHVLCVFLLYALWWSKPLEIMHPAVIRHHEWHDKIVSLMYMCSPICWDDDFITEMRCMIYEPPGQSDSPVALASPPPPDAENVKEMAETKKTEIIKKPLETLFPMGSIGSRDPEAFIGPLDFSMGSGGNTLDRNVDHVIHGPPSTIAREHAIFFELQKPSHRLRHSHYHCRRSLRGCTKHDFLTAEAINRWRKANEIIDELWEQCEKRPEYKDSFFMTSSIGIFMSESAYITDHIPNFPGFSDQGRVNTNRNSLKPVVGFAGAAHAGILLAAWNHYFPTPVERWLWISCALVTGVAGIILALFLLASQKIRVFEYLEHFFRNSPTIKWVNATIISPLLIIARTFVVVEAFISLRWAPVDIYKTPVWSNYIPHV